MIKVIKTLNPKPADTFSQEKVHIDQPDIIVTRSEKGWRIDLNNSKQFKGFGTQRFNKSTEILNCSSSFATL